MSFENIEKVVMVISAMIGLYLSYKHDSIQEKDTSIDNARENGQYLVNTALSLIEPMKRQIEDAMKEIEELREYKTKYLELKPIYDQLVISHRALQKLYDAAISLKEGRDNDNKKCR